MLGSHKKWFLREHLHLILLFNGTESVVERKNKRLLGASYCPVQSPEGRGADGVHSHGGPWGSSLGSRDLFFVDSTYR